jgi:hypothetical protein
MITARPKSDLDFEDFPEDAYQLKGDCDGPFPFTFLDRSVEDPPSPASEADYRFFSRKHGNNHLSFIGHNSVSRKLSYKVIYRCEYCGDTLETDQLFHKEIWI